ncbi:MAG: methyl-accepting chemotaxis protein [Gammaproteobacteria bacterium]|nr:methyl-accepting chemotaxis protein [Gammaproteobacteria bacterium]
MNTASIQLKLQLAFVIVFTLFVLAIVTATKGVFSTSERFDEFFSHNYIRQTAYQNMFSEGLLSGIALRNLVLKPTLTEPFKVVPQSIENFEVAYQTALKAAQGDNETLTELNTINTHWQASRAAKLKTLELIQAGDGNAANELLTKEEHPHWQQVRIAVQKLATSEEKRAMAIRQSMLDDKATTLRNAVVLTVIALLLGAVVAFLILRNIKQAFSGVIASLRNIAGEHGDLTQRLNDQGQDEVAELAGAFNQFVSKIQTLITQVANTAGQLGGSSKDLVDISVHTKLNMNQQESKIAQVATAMTQMTATVQEVARSASAASEAAHSADKQASSGNQVVHQVVQAIHDLANEVNETAQNIAALEKNAEQIGSVLDVIRGIAEQTNLLALNAAIEAARAGEQGRGFAVVADEVRTLASRTQESTREIQSMIERLQAGSRGAVQAMGQSQGKTQGVVALAQQAGESLATITQAVSRIADMNRHIATAAEEQSSVSEDINKNIVSINTLAVQAAESAEHTASKSQDLERVADELHQSIKVFTV